MVSAPDVPGHRVAEVLGSGGFATVYRAWQLSVGREVAVKVDNRVLLGDRDRRRFVREVTAAGRLSGHPHVIDVYDAGTLGDGRPYLVMELCPGGSLGDALRAHGPMSPGRVRDIGIRIADALAAAHAAGILHRDIKPANILVNRYGMVGLADFGLASIMAAAGEQTASRDALTPAYASPESFQGEEPSAAADIYSLAATLYALLAGLPPRFTPESPSPSIATIMSMHDLPVADIPGVPPEFMALLRTSLSSAPVMRPPGAAALRDALTGLAARPAPYAPAAAPAWPAAPPMGGTPAAGAGAPPAAGMGMPAAPSAHRRPAMPAAAPGRGGAGSWPSPGSRPPAPPRPRAAGQPGYPPPGPPGPGPRGSSPPGYAGAAPPGYPPAGPARPRPRPALWPLALAAALVLIAGLAVVGLRIIGQAGTGAAVGGQPVPGQGGHAAAAAVFGVPTVTAGCPAASVAAAWARCPAAPECWGGMVVMAGAASARSLPCGKPHYWETFAIAVLPAGARTFDQPALEANPTVRAVCSLRVLLRSRRLTALRPAAAWQVDVLPPAEAAFSSGARTYRCVGAVIGRQPRSSLFRR
ncbi:MAG: serine/threonine-protein kinase [Gemmatimonadota bacterium]